MTVLGRGGREGGKELWVGRWVGGRRELERDVGDKGDIDRETYD